MKNLITYEGFGKSKIPNYKIPHNISYDKARIVLQFIIDKLNNILKRDNKAEFFSLLNGAMFRFQSEYEIPNLLEIEFDDIPFIWSREKITNEYVDEYIYKLDIDWSKYNKFKHYIESNKMGLL